MNTKQTRHHVYKKHKLWNPNSSLSTWKCLNVGQSYEITHPLLIECLTIIYCGISQLHTCTLAPYPQSYQSVKKIKIEIDRDVWKYNEKTELGKFRNAKFWNILCLPHSYNPNGVQNQQIYGNENRRPPNETLIQCRNINVIQNRWLYIIFKIQWSPRESETWIFPIKSSSKNLPT